MPPDVPYCPEADGQMPLLMGQVVGWWYSAGNMHVVVWCSGGHCAKGLMAGQEWVGTFAVKQSHQLLCSWTEEHSGCAAPSQRCHSSELPADSSASQGKAVPLPASHLGADVQNFSLLEAVCGALLRQKVGCQNVNYYSL